MIEKLVEVDSVIIMKLTTGEEIVGRVVATNESLIQIKDARTVGTSPDGNEFGLMHTFLMGGDLQIGQIRHDNIIAYGQMSDKFEKMYLANVTGINLSVN